MSIQEVSQLISRIFQHLPSELGALPEDARAALKLAVSRALSEMDWVSREEFEVQQQVLARTRQKLAELSRRVEALEQKRSDTDTP